MSNLKTLSLEYHSQPRPGKLSVEITKPTATAKDLALAYSPGVAEPVREIARDSELAYSYTGKGNLVAVISNGTAILGLGDLGALASKPVMEGKGVLFKRFAGIDVFDIEVDTKDPQAFINTVKNIAGTFGGINLEDIKAPECFEIEQKLIELCDIPVFHDDQHGTAIVTAAGMLNALEIAGKKIEEAKIVCLGAGAAATSCMKLLVSVGAKIENIYMVDRKGIIHAERTDLNPYKAQFANKTDKRTLEDALTGADVFVGLSGPNLLSAEGLKLMAADPIVFACSNPDPEISPELAHATRPDVIMATGRSDYPNQVNNVLGFPFIFRGALDVRATAINEEMKIAAAYALRDLAKHDVPKEVCDAYGADCFNFGREYIIPKPNDPRLLTVVSDAVAKAAIDSGVATLPYPNNYPLQSVEDVFTK
ncbi:malic enzyme-like NAD(P)-binding protein [Entomomonas asaccharolytica]|uniref:NADP-dependent malic enzyme n=1 Tax=Entomomonas asaccharolytica TaxID=2785331 RepID=A0A974NEF6_9GAMM|nr:malic enzyme-like NAD(P)-binding protein [Entomomonas asaccharolytica]QQP84957.1 malate dehydrogenase [Entomomonas asaccharolytica]